jgi:hypothetical protein
MQKLERKMPPQTFSAGFVRACASDMHLDISERPFYAETYRKNAVHQRLGARFARACGVEIHMDTSQGKLYYAEIYWKNAAPREHRTSFARVCLVDMRMDKTQEPFYAQILRAKRSASNVTRAWAVKMHNGHVRRAALCGNLAPQTLGARFVRACVAQMRMDMWEEPYLSRNLQENAAPATQVLCEPVQLQCTWARRKSIFGTNSREKCCASDFYTSLRGRNAHGHVRKAALHGNLGEKMPCPRCYGACFARACAIEMHMDM